ncbi:MAG TPA: DUF885 family protein [Asticcacaulis sp.]|nr:DUF885 family protein [Asticcacaulis sp.]
MDRRALVASLAALLGVTAADALAKAKKKPGKSSGKKSSKKSSAKSSKSKKGKTAPPKKAPPKVVAEPPPPPAPETSSPEAVAAMNAAFDGILRELLTTQPALVTYLGLDKGEYAYLKSKFEDRSEASKAATIARLRRAVDALNKVDRGQLNAADRINYDTVVWDFSNQLVLAQGYNYGDMGTYAGGFSNPYVVSQLSGAYQFVPDFLDSQHSIAKQSDAEAYLARLEAFPRMLDQENERIKLDAARGVVPPDFILKGAIAQLTALRDVDPTASTLINSLDTRCTAAGIAGTWKDQATALVTGPVKEALSRQIDALTALQDKAKHDASVAFLPNGDAYYDLCAKLGTTTDMTPRDIHALGLDQVAKLSDEIDRRLKAQGLTQGSPGERMRGMYSDARFLYPNTDDGKAKLLADLNAKVATVQAKLPGYFGVLPKAKVVIKRVPVATEAGAPGGYYNPPSLDGSRPGTYYINLRDTGNNPSWLLPTLTYHESIPGHHLQGSIQNEAEGLPMLRKLSGFNAYVEGWALYAEQLAGEMGLYDTDPWGRIGYLHDALFRAVRLVVDTGIHDMRWSREQAIAYMCDYTGDTESQATAEIERYCVWPGQALGYMVGKLTWLRLRDAQKAKQGAAFDIKGFHDAGLLTGAVPLAVLETVYKSKGLI